MSWSLLIAAGVASHLMAAVAYLILLLLLARWGSRTLFGLALMAASLATFAWAAVAAHDLYVGAEIGRLGKVLEIARSCSWIVVLLSALYWLSPKRWAGWTMAIVGLGVAVIALTATFGSAARLQDGRTGSLTIIVGDFSIALIGLALVENIFRNAEQLGVWSIKYFCFALGAIFAYDFFLYSDAFFFRRLDLGLLLARGATNALVVPLVAIFARRNRAIGPRISVSRRFVFHSATLLCATLYLVAMAAAGYYVREFGGAWSTFLDAVFFFGAVLLLLVSVSSGTFRAYLRVLVEKTFFKYRYDYRDEWLRFIETTSATADGKDLRGRVVQAVCDIVGSPEGGLWLMREPGRYSLAAAWNLSRWPLDDGTAIAATSSLVAYLEHQRWIISLDEYAASPQRYRDLDKLPEWLRALPRAWLIVPLVHRDRLYGILIVGRPRVPRGLTWEDFDILKTVGRQAASILAQHDADAALAEVRQFEAFNKRFAFVAHDVKNLASQLSLILSNAARHRGNVAFQDDMIQTVRQSVDKLNRMLRQLHAKSTHLETEHVVELGPLLRQVVAQQAQMQHTISLDLKAEAVKIKADEERLKAVVDHLVQNALEAIGEDGRVEVRLSETGEMVALEIEDNGPGMDPDFVRDHLFRPFDSTKSSGYGIGVYESQEYARSLGGRIEVISRPGYGTIMRMCLPRLAAQ